MNATMRPSGERVGARAESVKSVSCVYFTPAGWGRGERYRPVPPMAAAARTPTARRHTGSFGGAGVGEGRLGSGGADDELAGFTSVTSGMAVTSAMKR